MIDSTQSLDVLERISTALAGRYHVQRQLGAGGMATVFLAADEKHGREVAIKVLHPDLAANLGAERFEREIRLAAKLHHPHILGLHDSGVADGLMYYVMPYVQGESLRDRIDRNGPLPVDDAVTIALEVNDALGYAHSQGVVHRDIKPENIMLSQGHALVADFGIARAFDAGNQKLTQTGMSMGTPYYMAPEQASGDPVGPTADLYSLGCVLYEMLVGEPPFTGKNAMQIMARHAMEQVPSVRIVRQSVPEGVENAIFAAMGKVPADRPQSATQFAELLGLAPGFTASMRARTPMSGVRRPTGVDWRAVERRPWWRRPLIIASAAAVVLVGSAAAVYFASSRRPSSALSADAHRIAVLYFDDLSKDHSLAPVADGLTEGLIQSLSTVPSLTVISRGGAERFRGSAAPLDSIARVLRAGYLVRGEVEPDGGQVRVTLRLADASGAALRRATFVRPAENAVAMADSVTVLASDLIKRELHEDIRARASRERTHNSTAWLLVQRGEQERKNLEAAAARGDTAGMTRATAAADSLFAAAEREDKQWAEAPTQRALLAYRRSRLAGFDPTAIRPWVDVGLGHADRALTVNPDYADALEVRGNLRYWGWLVGIETEATKRNAALQAAKADLEKATTINPNQAGAYASLSHLYYQTGTPTDVNIAAQRAYEADEFLSNAEDVLNRLFLSSYDLGQFDKANQWCGDFGRRFPSDVRGVRCQLYMLTTRITTPDARQAWKLADSVVALTPAAKRDEQRLDMDMIVAAVLARASAQQPALADSARHVAKRSEGSAAADPTRDRAYTGAFVHTLLGDNAEAIRLLKEYIAANPQRAKSFADDPGWWLLDLARDPRFRQAVGER